MDINAIERVLDKRASRGASDSSLIAYLESLKTIHKDHHADLDGLIDAIKQTPLVASTVDDSDYENFLENYYGDLGCY